MPPLRTALYQPTGRKRRSLLAGYPARYRSSGLMTFIVNHQGIIYEKDLGYRTTDLAVGMTSFDPDPTWRRVKPAELPIAPN